MNVIKKFILSFRSIQSRAVLYSAILFSVINGVNAQEKESLKIKSTTVEYLINKNTKDNELEEIKKEVNDEKIANLAFSNIKRNDKGEIIAISTSFKDERGSSQQKSEYNSNGISDFTVKIHQNESGQRYLELGAKSQQMFNIANDPQAGRALYSEQVNEDFEDFFSQDFMQLLQGMQEDMKAQQEAFKKILEAQEQKDAKKADTTKVSSQNTESKK